MDLVEKLNQEKQFHKEQHGKMSFSKPCLQCCSILFLVWCLFCSELTEECGLKAHSLTKVGLLNFEFIDDPMKLEIHVFHTSDYSGTVVETEGMGFSSVNALPISA